MRKTLCPRDLQKLILIREKRGNIIRKGLTIAKSLMVVVHDVADRWCVSD